MADLRGRTIVVAGGTGGLGSATAKLLAAEGATIVMGYAHDAARAERIRQECGSQTLVCAADIRTVEGRRALLDCAGNLYGLVVFVGDPARGTDEETLRRSIETNFLGPALLAREAAERMRAAGTKGAIVLLASMQAVHVLE